MPRIPEIGPPPGPGFVDEPANARPGMVGAALAGFGERMSRLGEIFNLQAEQADRQRAIDQSTKFATDLADIRAGIPASANPQDAVAQFTAQSQQLVDRYTQDPANARIQDLLGPEISRIHGRAMVDAHVDASRAATVAAEATTMALLPQLANRAISSLDPVEAETAVRQAHGLIDQLPFEKQEAQRIGFQQKLVQLRGAYIAANEPQNLNAFIDRNRDKLTPDQVNSLHSQQLATFQRPQQAFDAAYAAQRAAANSEVDALLAAKQPQAKARAQELLRSRAITDMDYERRFHEPAPEQDAPGMFDWIQDQIRANPDAWSDSLISATLGLSRTSKAQLTLELGKLKKQATTDLGQLAVNARRMVTNTVETSGNPYSDSILNLAIPREERTKMASDLGRLFDLRMQTAKTPDEVQAIEQQMQDAGRRQIDQRVQDYINKFPNPESRDRLRGMWAGAGATPTSPGAAKPAKPTPPPLKTSIVGPETTPTPAAPPRTPPTVGERLEAARRALMGFATR